MKDGQKVSGIRRLFSRLRKPKRKQTVPASREDNKAGRTDTEVKSSSGSVGAVHGPSGGIQDMRDWFNKLERNKESPQGVQEIPSRAIGGSQVSSRPDANGMTRQSVAEEIGPVQAMTEKQCVMYECPTLLSRSPEIAGMPSTSQIEMGDNDLDTVITSHGEQTEKILTNEMEIKRTKSSRRNETDFPHESIPHHVINEDGESHECNTLMSVDSVATDTLMSQCNAYHRDIDIEGAAVNSITASAAADALTSDQRRPIAIVTPQIREESLAAVPANSVIAPITHVSPPSYPGLSPRIPSEIVYLHQLQRSQLQQQQRIEQELLDLEQRREIDDIGNEHSVDYSNIGTMDTDILLQPLDVSNPTFPGHTSSGQHSHRQVQLGETSDIAAIRDVSRRGDNVSSSVNGRFRRTRSAPRVAQPSRQGSYNGTRFRSFEEADASSGEYFTRKSKNMEDDWLVARLHNLRSDLIRLPGVLVLGVRRGGLVIYVSRDRPNIPAVRDFMHRNGISDRDYECKLMPSRFRPTDAVETIAIVRG
ncbi:hypothetical protein CAPTEDRAFT_222657 [Capitella teleta]|uniref:Uncharacterized protein n=1 Tax=Capitella teleta TaxID=283909 RepID=R7U1N1_CAPTE|nr:hypothetical protein CAPTEDRAFT_222657 [Capitella teleta]|eukprot:ELT99772.1 hypothetical protein CAPTEDRAFT_222657 [Capitella teleta]